MHVCVIEEENLYIREAHCSFNYNNEGTGYPTNKTIAAVLAILITYLTNKYWLSNKIRTFVAVPPIFIL